MGRRLQVTNQPARNSSFIEMGQKSLQRYAFLIHQPVSGKSTGGRSWSYRPMDPITLKYSLSAFPRFPIPLRMAIEKVAMLKISKITAGASSAAVTILILPVSLYNPSILLHQRPAPLQVTISRKFAAVRATLECIC